MPSFCRTRGKESATEYWFLRECNSLEYERIRMAGPLGFEPRTSGSAGQCHNPSARKNPMILDLPVVLDYGPQYEDYNNRIIKTFQQMVADLDYSCNKLAVKNRSTIVLVDWPTLQRVNLLPEEFIGIRGILCMPGYFCFFGVSIMSASWIFLLLTTIFDVEVTRPYFVNVEEAECLGYYGASYQEYMNRTPRWMGYRNQTKRKKKHLLVS